MSKSQYFDLLKNQKLKVDDIRSDTASEYSFPHITAPMP